jgi:serine/threonine protein kinase/tetratricopeptide (TPR) repeat protein
VDPRADKPAAISASDLLSTLSLSGPLYALLTRVLEEMHVAWEKGQPLSAEIVLKQHPELARETGAALQIIHEEVILRRKAGQNVPTVEVASRFPQWEGHLKKLLECHHFVEEIGEKETIFPEVGELLGDFELVAELGRGAQGRVYLARQEQLADRFLVLKMSPCSGREHLSLARLQHTNIVPLYWAQDLLPRNLRILVFPYLGGATLADVLGRLADRPPAQLSGADLLTALDEGALPELLALPLEGPARQALVGDSYVQAICRIGASLAEALHYAHERGLLHLDVKPSNVLLAADGQPMLLDFHIARSPLKAGDSALVGFGGTPGYMSPEQERLLEAVKRGAPAPEPVDGRSDIYSLGRLLYEALGGELPESSVPAGPALRRLNPQVSMGLADIVAHCLANRPEDRYPDAGTLAADLRRHLEDQPLRGVANRSWAERWRKWRRRAPYALPLAGLLLALLGVLLTAGLLTWRQMSQHESAVKAMLDRGRDLAAGHRYAEAVETLTEGRHLADTSFLTRSLLPTFDQHLRLARRGKAAQDLHEVAEQFRVLAVMDSLSKRGLAVLDKMRRKAWAERILLLDRAGAPLQQSVEQAIRDDLLDLTILWAELAVEHSPAGKVVDDRESAVRALGEVEQLLGPTAVLAWERQQFGRAPGQANPPLPALHTTWERMALGRALLRAGRLGEAANVLEQAVTAEPDSFWVNFCLGTCAARLGQPQRAIRCFSTCIGKEPGQPHCFLRRGLAFAELGKKSEALRDYERALGLAPNLAQAHFHRGVLLFDLKRYDEALHDLKQAQTSGNQGLDRGADPAEVHYYLALVHLARHDPTAALASLDAVLCSKPHHEGAKQLRAKMTGGY